VEEQRGLEEEEEGGTEALIASLRYSSTSVIVMCEIRMYFKMPTSMFSHIVKSFYCPFECI